MSRGHTAVILHNTILHRCVTQTEGRYQSVQTGKKKKRRYCLAYTVWLLQFNMHLLITWDAKKPGLGAKVEHVDYVKI